MIFHSIGILKYSKHNDVGHKLIVQVDQNIAVFYRSLIPKYFSVNPQKYRAHISVIRHETPVYEDYWGKYQNEKINFSYDNFIHNGKVYWWINVFSTRLEEIRLELGLPNSSKYTLPPEGFTKCFHITLANNKKII